MKNFLAVFRNARKVKADGFRNWVAYDQENEKWHGGNLCSVLRINGKHYECNWENVGVLLREKKATNTVSLFGKVKLTVEKKPSKWVDTFTFSAVQKIEDRENFTLMVTNDMGGHFQINFKKIKK